MKKRISAAFFAFVIICAVTAVFPVRAAEGDALTLTTPGFSKFYKFTENQGEKRELTDSESGLVYSTVYSYVTEKDGVEFQFKTQIQYFPYGSGQIDSVEYVVSAEHEKGHCELDFYEEGTVRINGYRTDAGSYDSVYERYQTKEITPSTTYTKLEDPENGYEKLSAEKVKLVTEDVRAALIGMNAILPETAGVTLAELGFTSYQAAPTPTAAPTGGPGGSSSLLQTDSPGFGKIYTFLKNNGTKEVLKDSDREIGILYTYEETADGRKVGMSAQAQYESSDSSKIGSVIYSLFVHDDSHRCDMAFYETGEFRVSGNREERATYDSYNTAIKSEGITSSTVFTGLKDVYNGYQDLKADDVTWATEDVQDLLARMSAFLPQKAGVTLAELGFAEDTAPAPTPAPGSASGTTPMYRLYNPNSGEHFYTAQAGEKNYLVSVGWNDEGIGWTAPKSSGTPVYRLYNPNAGDHHYTMSEGERNMLIAVGWNDEGIGWYSDDDKGVPLYRQYNPNAKAGSHNYTISKGENDYLVSVGWNAEGIGWYGVK